jgi:hypothetical protein
MKIEERVRVTSLQKETGKPEPTEKECIIDLYNKEINMHQQPTTKSHYSKELSNAGRHRIKKQSIKSRANAREQDQAN